MQCTEPKLKLSQELTQPPPNLPLEEEEEMEPAAEVAEEVVGEEEEVPPKQAIKAKANNSRSQSQM